jgi:hypothetical protein
MPVAVFECADFAALVRFGSIEVVIRWMEDEVRISRGDVYPVG